jgi:formate dehydrogenase assembly factor FdhD
VTVGSHWPLTGPLSQAQREKMERTQICTACHKEMSNAQLWQKLNTRQILDDDMHSKMINQLMKRAAKKQSDQKNRMPKITP